ncbi:MAG: histidine phosphatase family protein [Gordonia paraffinivorans]
MGSLHLIRHGQTTSNVMARLDTRPPGAGLTDFGARQAVRFGLLNPDVRPRGAVQLGRPAVRGRPRS